MDKVYFAIAYYGDQSFDWSLSLAMMTGTLNQLDIELVGAGGAGSMMADSNRNSMVEEFLATDADWLFWLDTDNFGYTAGVRRLLDTGRTLVSGIYYNKNEPYNMIAYYRQPNNMYRPVDEKEYERGEIIPVDAAGCGFLLTHRSVYEDIRKTHTVYQDTLGRYWLVHNGDVKGKVSSSETHSSDDRVVNGQLRVRLRPVFVDPKSFPWFQIYGGRTEDMIFFERATRVGHKPWLDTSVEAGHERRTLVTGEIRRKYRWKIKEKVIEEPHQPIPFDIKVSQAVEDGG